MDVKERLIVQKLRNGEQDAYRYLYDRHYVLLCQFANELVGDPFLAETIVGDVIFHLWEIRETLDINSSLRDRKSTRLNSSHPTTSRMPSSA